MGDSLKCEHGMYMLCKILNGAVNDITSFLGDLLCDSFLSPAAFLDLTIHTFLINCTYLTCFT